MVYVVVNNAAHTEDSGLNSKWNSAHPGLCLRIRVGLSWLLPAPPSDVPMQGHGKPTVQLLNLYSFNFISKNHDAWEASDHLSHSGF